MLVQLPPPSLPSAMSRQNAEHVRLEIRSNEIDNEFAGWERPFAEQEGETGQMLGFCSPKIQFARDSSRLCLALRRSRSEKLVPHRTTYRVGQTLADVRR